MWRYRSDRFGKSARVHIELACRVANVRSAVDFISEIPRNGVRLRTHQILTSAGESRDNAIAAVLCRSRWLQTLNIALESLGGVLNG